METAYAPQPHGSRVPEGLRAPFSGRAWREFLYLFLSLPLSIVMFTYAMVVITTGAGLLITFLGIPLLAGGLAGARALGGLERGRARALLGLDVADPGPVRPSKPSLMGWVGAVLKSGASWRHLLYSLLHFPWALFSFIFSVTFWTLGWALLTYPLWRWTFPAYFGRSGIQLWGDGDGHGVWLDTPAEIAVTGGVGLLLVLAGPWVIHGLTQVDRVMVHGLLGPSSLATRAWQLESDRGVVVDTAAADLRRIERDLHDGAQARLASLALDLGLAKEKLAEDPAAAARMVDEAHGEVKIALQELRDLARGIHPAILSDRGLGPALSALSARCTVPVTVTVDLDRRPAAAIEGIAYFTASELLRNVSQHSGAACATLDVWHTADRLMMLVADNGHGGAHTGPGTGLAALTERLAAVDGLLLVDSPACGPTCVTAELPWRG
ncbi:MULTISPECIES: sensor histidine kinase [unclassified Streptomyces]|uniref:sensor histidine kinase n=1 Tax=unclassified Streptomyces TaxID=2593676 RepID=UPI0008857886|nr:MULTISPECIES: sensor histidine kinase [unclassified Streptomyces]PBC83200.1 signal transduction histidine kinase [Streptomyces sp. 2321.6]SDR44298.1 Signal transduction histidine kinase [Streptomyces sp. KS_16]SEC87864.1 Signal transduction histidine kinase [Streptomyces sp. 2133.1]SNC69278.1 Signal transduction histidine kinase [Streptomyces sp. 2114.4]